MRVDKNKPRVVDKNKPRVVDKNKPRVVDKNKPRITRPISVKDPVRPAGQVQQVSIAVPVKPNHLSGSDIVNKKLLPKVMLSPTGQAIASTLSKNQTVPGRLTQSQLAQIRTTERKIEAIKVNSSSIKQLVPEGYELKNGKLSSISLQKASTVTLRDGSKKVTDSRGNVVIIPAGSKISSTTGKVIPAQSKPIQTTLSPIVKQLQQKLSDEKGIATFTTKGEISTVPTLKSGGFSDIFVNSGKYDTFDDFADATIKKQSELKQAERNARGDTSNEPISVSDPRNPLRSFSKFEIPQSIKDNLPLIIIAVVGFMLLTRRKRR